MTADTKAAAPPKKSFLKSKKGLIVLVLLLVVGGAACKFMAPPAKAGPPVGGEIVPMDPTTVNLKNGHYLKIAIAVQLVEGKGTADAFKSSEAAELVIDEFSDRTVAEVSANDERKKLAEGLETKIKKAYKDEVFAIFLTQFVTQ